MKNFIWKLSLASLLIFGAQVYAQQRADQTQPLVSISMENHSYDFEAGSVHDIPILLVRSEGGEKIKFSGLKIMGSKDIRIDIAQVSRKGDAYSMKIKVPATAESKKNHFVLMGDGLNSNLIKGTTFSIRVVKSQATVKN